MANLFDYIVEEATLHPHFRRLAVHPACDPARNIMNEIFASYKDVDGNFIEQFQTSGFHARLWELFLFQYINSCGYNIDRSRERPDYNLINGYEFFIEAVTSNPTDNDKITEGLIQTMETTKDNEERDAAQSALIDHYVIKIASALYSKLTNHKYWELEWVKGKTLVLAIQAVHHKYATFFPDYKIIAYLYGKELKSIKQEDGTIKNEYVDIESHEYELAGKKIPSGFFNIPDSENISAVIFANTGDEKKFLRMGLQEGFAKLPIYAVRAGAIVDHNSEKPKEFEYTVGDGTHQETWSEGVNIFHNPNAKIPLSRDALKGSRHMWWENGEFIGTILDFQPITSITGAFMFNKDKVYIRL